MWITICTRWKNRCTARRMTTNSPWSWAQEPTRLRRNIRNGILSMGHFRYDYFLSHQLLLVDLCHQSLIYIDWCWERWILVAKVFCVSPRFPFTFCSCRFFWNLGNYTHGTKMNEGPGRWFEQRRWLKLCSCSFVSASSGPSSSSAAVVLWETGGPKRQWSNLIPKTSTKWSAVIIKVHKSLQLAIACHSSP